MPGPVWQRSGAGQLLAQIAPSVGSQAGVAQLGQKAIHVKPHRPVLQVPVWQQTSPKGLLVGAPAVQVVPQPPQLPASLWKSTQTPPQQASPVGQPTGAMPQVWVAGSQIGRSQGSLEDGHWPSSIQQLFMPR